MAAITIILLTGSLPKLDKFIQYASTTLQKQSVYWPGLLLVMLSVTLFLISKGLYPAGGHDYYTHYFYYYKEVIESGSILPGRIWYHFYYDKGMGLFFLSMLLTDPLAPQLVTTAMIFAAAAIIFSLVRQATSWRLLPWVGVAFYMIFLIYTPGPPEAVRETGWFDLEKSHEPAALLMFAIIWITICLAKTNERRTWGLALILCMSALAIMSSAMAVFAIIYLITVILYFIIDGNKSAALWSMGSLIAASIWLASLLLINYLLTGFPDEQSVLIWWPVINFDKVNQWGGLVELIHLNHERIVQKLNKLPLSTDYFEKVITYLRLDIWGPLLLMIILSTYFVWQKANRRNLRIQFQQNKIPLYALGGFLFLSFLLSFIIGRDQSVSFYRFTSFTYAPILCFCLIMLSTLLSNYRKWASLILILGFLSAWAIVGNNKFMHFIHKQGLLYLLLVLILPIIHQFYPKKRPHIRFVLGIFLTWIVIGHSSFSNKNLFLIIKHGNRFATGQYSIADAYRHQEGRPGHMRWGAIYPAAEIIWHQLPPNTRIWSMHSHSYCMLPDCDMESFVSFQMSPHEETVYYGNPEEAKEFLKKENLNYFFFSNKLALKDPLPASPLFSPDHIADFLGIAWTDGDDTLLTWKEQAHFPIDTAWLNRYRESASHAVNINPYKDVLNIAHTTHKVKSSDMPWYKSLT